MQQRGSKYINNLDPEFCSSFYPDLIDLKTRYMRSIINFVPKNIFTIVIKQYIIGTYKLKKLINFSYF